MRVWDLREIHTPGGSRSPVVLHSDDEGRAILVALEPGQALGHHEVKEHAFVTIVSGTAEIETSSETLIAEPGMLFFFEPEERRSISTRAGARLLFVLAPWPGEGHYRGERPA